ncbi:hypothetical protein [Azonexus hydrophilus]|uniref:Uncharacterized protein n=1 Tax=Azonexus hydrophilus TaxID=418702 RepID=A0ABZ2XLI7_9RHOO
MNQDLFGLTVEVTERSFSSIYCSGGSAFWDAQGILEAGRQVGAVALDLPSRTIGLLKAGAQQGVKSFVDSGAFTAFKQGGVLDFDAVFDVYDHLLEGLERQQCWNFSIVMPDVIGDQAGSFALWERYRQKIAGYVSSGADVIIPIHNGAKSVQEVGKQLVDMFGPEIRFGIPSNAAALSDAEIAKLDHNRFHILGKAALDAKLRRRTYSILESNPWADVSCDANLIRSRLHEVSSHHRELIEAVEDPFCAEFDDTELIYEVIHTPGWMKRSEIASICTMYGVLDAVSVRRWCNTHAKTGLAKLVEENDPEGTILYCLLPHAFSEAARKAMSARLRSKAVAAALAA